MMMKEEIIEERMILEDKIKYRKYQEYISCRLIELKVRQQIRQALKDFYDKHKDDGLVI